MTLEDDLDALKDALDSEADAIEIQVEQWEDKLPAYLYNWLHGALMIRANEKRDVVERIDALLE